MASTIDRLITEIKKLTATEKFELARRLDETGVFDENQSWFWTPQWQAGEKEADEDTAAGRTMRFNRPEKAIEYLHQATKREK